MADHGLNLDRFLVSRDGQRQDAGEHERERQQPRRRTPQRTAADGTEPRFEVVV